MTTIQSFYRPESFALVLRGRKLILGEVNDVCDGDLRITGNKKHGYLQVAEFRQGKTQMLGGLWGHKRHALPLEVAERVLDTMRTLRADEFFVALSALIAAEARSATPPAVQFVDAIKRAMKPAVGKRHKLSPSSRASAQSQLVTA